MNRTTLEFILSCNGTGNAIIISVGGAAESRYCTLGVHCMTLKNRKGFLKLALVYTNYPHQKATLIQGDTLWTDCQTNHLEVRLTMLCCVLLCYCLPGLTWCLSTCLGRMMCLSSWFWMRDLGGGWSRGGYRGSWALPPVCFRAGASSPLTPGAKPINSVGKLTIFPRNTRGVL